MIALSFGRMVVMISSLSIAIGATSIRVMVTILSPSRALGILFEWGLETIMFSIHRQKGSHLRLVTYLV
jgi:hypothetical protein